MEHSDRSHTICCTACRIIELRWHYCHNHACRPSHSAWKFLDFLFTKGPRVDFSKSEGFLPTTKAEASDPALNGPDTRAFIALLPNARFAPTVAGWEDTGKAVSDAMQSVYLGKAQPAAALNAAAEKANQSLGK